MEYVSHLLSFSFLLYSGGWAMRVRQINSVQYISFFPVFGGAATLSCTNATCHLPRPCPALPHFECHKFMRYFRLFRRLFRHPNIFIYVYALRDVAQCQNQRRHIFSQLFLGAPPSWGCPLLVERQCLSSSFALEWILTILNGRTKSK